MSDEAPRENQQVDVPDETLIGASFAEENSSDTLPFSLPPGAVKPPLTVEQFAQRAVSAGILTDDEIEGCVANLPEADRPGTADELAQTLLNAGLLTAYQSDVLCAGRPDPLCVGDYVVIERLGEGGMGAVYKARHPRLKQRVVAVKILSSSVLDSASVISRFQREVEVIARLDHPHIVAAYDTGEDPRFGHYLVMQYVEGVDLATQVREAGPLTLSQAIRFVGQAAQGLDYVHKAGMIHRDIKPANLLLEAGGTIKILDMGLAGFTNADGMDVESTDLTQAGSVMGTVDYMAPEQALDTTTADHRSDIYSLGCVFYFLLTGRQAYQGNTVMRKILAHREQEIPSIHDVRPDLPAEVQAVIEKMMGKQPQDRYQSAAELIVALEAVSPADDEGDVNPQPVVAVGTASPATNSLSDEDTGVLSAVNVLSREAADQEKANAVKSVVRFLDGCGSDQFITSNEEQAIFYKGGELELSLTDVEACLNQRCRGEGWTRESVLRDQLAVMVQQATKDDGKIDQQEFEHVVNFGVKRHMPCKDAEELCVTLILNNSWRPKQTFFNKWFDAKKRAYGL